MAVTSQAVAAPPPASSLDFHRQLTRQGATGAAGGTNAARSLLAIALQLSQAGEEQSTCPFPNNGPASVQEARSDLFSLLCPLWPVIKGPSHCLNHFHDSVTSILRSRGWDSQPAQSRGTAPAASGTAGSTAGWGAWEKEGECWPCLSPPCPLCWRQRDLCPHQPSWSLHPLSQLPSAGGS